MSRFWVLYEIRESQVKEVRMALVSRNAEQTSSFGQAAGTDA